MMIEGVKPPPPEITGQIQPSLQSSAAPSLVTQQVITATGTLTQRPLVAPRPIGTPIQQLPVCTCCILLVCKNSLSLHTVISISAPVSSHR